MTNIGFLLRSKQLRDKYEGHIPEDYILALDVLSPIATENKNTLPSLFNIEATPNLSIKTLKNVLKELYPEYNFICTDYTTTIYCFRF